MNKYIKSNGTKFGYHTLIMKDETALAQGAILATNEIINGLKNKTMCWSGGQIIPYSKTAQDLAQEEKEILRARITQLKRNLAKTDYQAIKYAEGELTLEEYSATKAQRAQWRLEINQLETYLEQT